MIEDLKAILASEARQRQIIKDELEDMKKKYGDPRRSEITIDTSDLDVEDLIADEEMVITLTKTRLYQTHERERISQPT